MSKSTTRDSRSAVNLSSVTASISQVNIAVFLTLDTSSMTTEVVRTIRSKAPTRIDLAGGTLDIWPLYLFLKTPITLNLAIDLYAETKLEETNEPGKITLRSEDQGAELSFTWHTIEETPAPPSLILHHR